jgi:hypothetical protein
VPFRTQLLPCLHAISDDRRLHFLRPAPRPEMHATTMEPRSKLLAGYSKASRNLSTLEDSQATVACGFDAHNILSSLNASAVACRTLKFERVVCNFPCIGNSTWGKQVAMRRWIRSFLRSAKEVLASGGEIWLSLKAGQSEQHQWQLAAQLSSVGLRQDRVIRFPYDKLSRFGYSCRRGVDWDHSFPCRDGRTHIIVSD